MRIHTSEKDIVDLDESFEDPQNEKLSLRLVGRILTEKAQNFDAVKRMLQHIWSLKNGIIISSMG